MTVAASYYEGRRARIAQPRLKLAPQPDQRRTLNAPATWPSRCVYCGGRARIDLITCHKHRGLVALDPYYTTARAPRRELHRV